MIEVDPIDEYLDLSVNHAWRAMMLTLEQVGLYLAHGKPLGIRVDGWSDPWPLLLDGGEGIRARCPTSPNVIPRVIVREVKP